MTLIRIEYDHEINAVDKNAMSNSLYSTRYEIPPPLLESPVEQKTTTQFFCIFYGLKYSHPSKV